MSQSPSLDQSATARIGFVPVFGLLARLFLTRGRNRADLCYEFMGTQNCPSPDCMYLNLGYWKTATDYRSAAEALVDLLADTVDIAEGDVVIDAGCGFGEQDVRIARRKRPSRLLAINVTEGQLAYAREHNSHPAIAYMNCSATRLPLPDSSVDKVMSLEAAFHFHTREAFLREAFRVLRPGGRIGVVDLVPLERNGKPLTGGLRGSLERWGHQVPTENLYGTKRYGEILEEVGFSDCTLQSINEEVVPGFFRFVGELLANPEATQRLHPLVRRAYARLRSPLGTPFDMSDYILVAAQKPAS